LKSNDERGSPGIARRSHHLSGQKIQVASLRVDAKLEPVYCSVFPGLRLRLAFSLQTVVLRDLVF